MGRSWNSCRRAVRDERAAHSPQKPNSSYARLGNGDPAPVNLERATVRLVPNYGLSVFATDQERARGPVCLFFNCLRLCTAVCSYEKTLYTTASPYPAAYGTAFVRVRVAVCLTQASCQYQQSDAKPQR